MDKPINMSVKEYLMRTMSLRTNTPLKYIEAVVEHQFKEAHEVMNNKNGHTIEFSGLGKFIFMPKKASRIMDASSKKIEILNRRLSGDITDEERRKVETKILTLEKYINILKLKIDGDIKNTGGVAKQANPTKGVEGDNPESISGEEKSM